jgi:hypothetical protein
MLSVHDVSRVEHDTSRFAGVNRGRSARSPGTRGTEGCGGLMLGAVGSAHLCCQREHWPRAYRRPSASTRSRAAALNLVEPGHRCGVLGHGKGARQRARPVLGPRGLASILASAPPLWASASPVVGKRATEDLLPLHHNPVTASSRSNGGSTSPTPRLGQPPGT